MKRLTTKTITMSALSLWLEISAENKQVRSKGKLCSKLMPRCKNVPRALSICQQRERSTLFSLSLASPLHCVLYLKDTRVHWQQLTLLAAASFAPKHAQPKTKDPRAGDGDRDGPQLELSSCWHSTSAGLFLLPSLLLRSCRLTNCLPARRGRGRGGRRDRGNSRQLHDEMPETASVNAVYVAFFSFLLHATNDSLVDGNGDRMCKCHKEVSTCLQQQQLTDAT